MAARARRGGERLMFGRKSSLIAGQAATIDQLRAQLAEVRDDARSHLDAAVLTVRRNADLRRQLDEQRPTPDSVEPAHARLLEQRLDRALRAAGRYLAALWAVRREIARLRKLLRRADEDRRALQTRLTQLQDANEALCREAVDRAGTLTSREAVSTR